MSTSPTMTTTTPRAPRLRRVSGPAERRQVRPGWMVCRGRIKAWQMVRDGEIK